MAIISVRKNFPSRGGKDTWKRKRTYTRVYEVVTDDALATEVDVANAVDPTTGLTVPVLYEELDVNPQALVTDVDAQTSDESPFIWFVTITYDTNPENAAEHEPDKPGGGDGQTAGPLDPDPTKRNSSWKLTFTDRQEIVREWVPVDANGSIVFTNPPAWVPATVYTQGTFVSNNANVYRCTVSGTSAGAGGPNGVAPSGIVDNTAQWGYVATVLQATTDPAFALCIPLVNSGKMPFDPPPMTDVSYPVVSIMLNVPPGFLSLNYALRIKNGINVKAWRGVPPRCAKIIKFELGRSQTENTFSYCEANWDIQLDPDSFDLRLLDSGFGSLQLRTVPNPTPPPVNVQKNKFFPFRDAAGAVMESPVPMDGHGNQLPELADPVILRGVPRQQKLVDFNDLSILPFG